ncbi:M23 family metallopeptidase [Micromonospora robiginosa]|uniref:M23 family metallopeptidase n=1 Tax=Micromonospora robiginosa TaxID=2749844 RepID=A0A7L6BEF1_9ACTN|nr:M23 family metallopeptidase [Micromonospora ferruginea]QLQ40333.2 M23 family metallopeptidase [Micromonospora ferruginea]
MRIPLGPALLVLLLVPGLTTGPGAPPADPAPAAAPAPAVGRAPSSAAPVPADALPPPADALPPLADALPPPAGARSSWPSAGPTPRGASPSAARFRWPLPGPPRPGRRFDPPPEPWLPGHRGVDLLAAPGAEVRAAGAGTVLFAGSVAGRPVVTVGHGDGLRTTYEPVRPRLAAGDRVHAGTPIGDLLPGHPGCADTACLHWGLRRGDAYLDPLALLGLGRIRLLPLEEADPGAGTRIAQRPASSVGSRTANRSYSSGVL